MPEKEQIKHKDYCQGNSQVSIQIIPNFTQTNTELEKYNAMNLEISFYDVI